MTITAALDFFSFINPNTVIRRRANSPIPAYALSLGADAVIAWTKTLPAPFWTIMITWQIFIQFIYSIFLSSRITNLLLSHKRI